MESLLSIMGMLLAILSFLPGAAAVFDSNLNFVIASSTVAILLFMLCIVIFCVFYNCYPLYRSCGYERIPKEELKRKEIAQIIVNNGSTPRQYLTPIAIEGDAGSWVQRWNDAQTEERDAVMQLGPEDPEPEYRIETTLVDDETLDLGPYHVDDTSKVTAGDGLYATVDKTSFKKDVPSSTSGNGTPLYHSDIDSTALL